MIIALAYKLNSGEGADRPCHCDSLDTVGTKIYADIQRLDLLLLEPPTPSSVIACCFSSKFTPKLSSLLQL